MFDDDEDEPQVPMRRFDNGHMMVRVFEESDPNRGGRRLLVFETDYGRKTAEVYPSDWMSLTDAQLQDFALRHAD
jgi:hypothetical protein